MSAPVRTSILRMVASAFPSLIYGYPRTYIVRDVHDGGLLDLDPPPDASHLPPLKSVTQWSVGVLEAEEGTEVIVCFRDANPARPIVVGARGGAGDGETPPAVHAGRVVRWGDIAAGDAASSGTPYPLIPDATNPDISRLKG